MAISVSRRIVGTAVLATALAFPIGALASHTFSDVPTNNTFHGDIAAIAEAGVTTGCGSGKYCPKDLVTREQMAGFLNRLGALSVGKTPVVNAKTALTADTAEAAGLLDGLDSSQFVRGDVAVPGQTSCVGAQMVPEFGTMDWGMDGWFIYPKSGDNWFICGIHLPDGATITGFRGHFRDLSATEGARCDFRRSSWSDGSTTVLADPGATGDETTGTFIVKETTDIADPVVDNGAYAYWVECGVFEFGGDVGIFGVTVPYTVTGSPEE